MLELNSDLVKKAYVSFLCAFACPCSSRLRSASRGSGAAAAVISRSILCSWWRAGIDKLRNPQWRSGVECKAAGAFLWSQVR